MKLFNDIYIVAGKTLNSDPSDANTYLLDTQEGLVMIDSGGGYNVQQIYDEIEKDGFTKDGIKLIINTHCHFDHTGGNNQIRNETGCKTAIHVAEVDAIENITELTVAHIWGHDLKPCKVDIPLQGNESMRIGKYALNFHHAPGHTPGSIVISVEIDSKIHFFIGDCISLLDLPGESKELIIDSLTKLRSMQPDFLLTGHDGPVISTPSEYLTDCIEKFTR
jgi:glyoxylase-like metal-dependent hydrolase (beta-lactamase superfamily II)